MRHRSVLLLFAAYILHITSELRINQMNFCCSNTCCCSSCTAEQCQLPDQPGKQCRCYNTTNIMCSRFRVYEPAAVELPSEMQIFPTSSKQAVLAHVVPISISELSIDPLCCVVGDCPVWIKCKNPVKVRQDQPALQSMPLPLFIVTCILFTLIIITTIGLCIAASLYISDSQKPRERNIYNKTER